MNTPQELEKDNIYRELHLKQQKQKQIVKELEDKIKQLDQEISELQQINN